MQKSQSEAPERPGDGDDGDGNVDHEDGVDGEHFKMGAPPSSCFEDG